VTYLNPYWIEYTGLTLEQVNQLPPGTPVHPDDHQRVMAAWATSLQTGQSFSAEQRLRSKDGSYRGFLGSGTPVRNERSEIERWMGICVDIDERKRAEESLRESQERLAAELADSILLQAISAQMIQEECAEGLYEKILDVAISIMRSDYASMQMLYPERDQGGELRLLAFRGFNPDSAKFWEWVRTDSESTCGVALRTVRRVIVSDVEQCAFMAGTEDLATYLQTGIRAVQTTPLISRSGKLVGMISTHWRNRYEPLEHDLRILDVLARQAADLIERAQAETTLRESEALLKTEADALVRLNELSSRLCDRTNGSCYSVTSSCRPLSSVCTYPL
jgi:PAS domain S-box-containing protein